MTSVVALAHLVLRALVESGALSCPLTSRHVCTTALLLSADLLSGGGAMTTTCSSLAFRAPPGINSPSIIKDGEEQVAQDLDF